MATVERPSRAARALDILVRVVDGLIVLLLILMAAVVVTGGWQFQLSGRTVSMRSIDNLLPHSQTT